MAEYTRDDLMIEYRAWYKDNTHRIIQNIDPFGLFQTGKLITIINKNIELEERIKELGESFQIAKINLCPMCGGLSEYSYSELGETHDIICSNCGYNVSDDNTKLSAISLWNNRGNK